ncbi:MAG: histidine phosphatase family protein [Rhizobiaceae bacterium]
MIGYYLTHPQVQIDPQISIPDWSLSAIGRQRIVNALEKPWLKTIRRIVSSEERKAVETADIIGWATGIQIEIRPLMGENDRSSTGFLPPDQFEAAADEFFEHPARSWNGWEPADDAQARIVEAVGEVLVDHPDDQPILFVGHGAVGTLLKCRIADRPISRTHDQSAGGGNLFAFRLHERKLLRDWTPVERFEGVNLAR